MSSNFEIVQEFRDIVDEVIANQVENCEATGPTWPDYDKYAKAADLSFGSFYKQDGRSHVFGHNSEHVWEIKINNKLTAPEVRLSGTLAVISEIERPNSLIRSWSFESALGPPLSMDTSKIVDEIDDLEVVVKWARSPHLDTRAVGRLALMQPQEIEAVLVKKEEYATQARELYADLAKIARARRAPLPDIYLN